MTSKTIELSDGWRLVCTVRLMSIAFSLKTQGWENASLAWEWDSPEAMRAEMAEMVKQENTDSWYWPGGFGESISHGLFSIKINTREDHGLSVKGMDEAQLAQLQTFLREQFGNQRPEVQDGDAITARVGGKDCKYILVRACGVWVSGFTGRLFEDDEVSIQLHYRNGDLLWEGE